MPDQEQWLKPWNPGRGLLILTAEENKRPKSVESIQDRCFSRCIGTVQSHRFDETLAIPMSKQISGKSRSRSGREVNGRAFEKRLEVLDGELNDHCPFSPSHPSYTGRCRFSTAIGGFVFGLSSRSPFRPRPEQVAALIKGATYLLSDVPNKPLGLMLVVIQEVEKEDWVWTASRSERTSLVGSALEAVIFPKRSQRKGR